jgi:hypothetical protein
MDWRTLYIVPVEFCRTDIEPESRPMGRTAWGMSPIPGDPTKVLLDVKWDDNPNARAAFESLPGVLPIGYPWEPLPAAAVPLLASFQHFNAAYADAYARLDPASAAAEAYATAKARLDSDLAAIATIATPIVVAGPVPTVANGDSVAQALHKLGRRFWG